MSNTTDTIKSTIAGTFELPLESINEASSSESIEKWDSVGHINLVMALEQSLGLSFTMDEIALMKDFQAICKVVATKAGEVKTA